jgi:hypothetical protein
MWGWLLNEKKISLKRKWESWSRTRTFFLKNRSSAGKRISENIRKNCQEAPVMGGIGDKLFRVHALCRVRCYCKSVRKKLMLVE